MTNPVHRTRTLLGLLATGAVAAPTPDWEDRGRRWWSHIQFLADDRLEGRDTGSRGYEEAAQYVADQFRAAGLAPAGTDGYRQPLDLRVSRFDRATCSVELVRDGKPERLRVPEDVVFGVDSGTVGALDAEAVFAGFGLTIPESNYDDLDGLDVKGKWVVYIRGGPAKLPNAVKAHHASTEERRRALHKKGVAGVVFLLNPDVEPFPWPRLVNSVAMSRMELADPGVDMPAPFSMILAANPGEIDRLFAGTGHTFQEIRDTIRAGGSPPRFPLNARIRARVDVERTTARSENVVGVLRGGDPKLADEYVVLSAHLDHIGIGDPVNGDRIYSGAMDNASGVASLIEIARSLKESGTRPKRSILFLAVTGEEKGLLGSQYFATHPTVRGTIVANLNMDMFGPFYPLRYLEVQGLAESTLGDDIREVAGAVGVGVHPDRVPDMVLFIRSDQYNFIKQGVPALAFSFGSLPGSPEEKIFQKFLAERYHAPSDDLDQPVDRAAAARYNSILEQLAVRVANADRRPEWKPDSFFRRFAKSS